MTARGQRSLFAVNGLRKNLGVLPPRRHDPEDKESLVRSHQLCPAQLQVGQRLMANSFTSAVYHLTMRIGQTGVVANWWLCGKTIILIRKAAALNGRYGRIESEHARLAKRITFSFILCFGRNYT